MLSQHSILQVENIATCFRTQEGIVHAVNGISFELKKGELLGVVGESGSGKSVTMMSLLKLLPMPPAEIVSGKATFDGEDLLKLDLEKLRKIRGGKIGFIFQSFHLIPRLTAAENIEIPMILAGISKQVRSEKVNKALSRVNLTDRSDHRPEQLSGGQRQRVAIARSIVMEPKVLLADEPTGNLDSSSGKEIVKLIEELNAGGLTLIVVTHDKQIGKRSNRVVRLLDGKVIANQEQ